MCVCLLLILSAHNTDLIFDRGGVDGGSSSSSSVGSSDSVVPTTAAATTTILLSQIDISESVCVYV